MCKKFLPSAGRREDSIDDICLCSGVMEMRWLAALAEHGRGEGHAGVWSNSCLLLTLLMQGQWTGYEGAIVHAGDLLYGDKEG